MKESIKLIGKMLHMVKPLKFPLFCAIIFGTVGHLLAISIPVLGMVGILSPLGEVDLPYSTIFAILGIASLCRGIFAYLEQQRNHYIAFTILALIRDQVFTVLRRLCPAKLEGKERGNLITLITADIELLEVFYAHTISPVAIALTVGTVMVTVLTQFHPLYGMIALVAYLTVGGLLPCVVGKGDMHQKFRAKSGQLSSYYLDSIRGIEEIVQFRCGEKRLHILEQQSIDLEQESKRISRQEGRVQGLGDGLVLGFGGVMFLASSLHASDLGGILLPTVMMMSSFGPVLALSRLSVGLSRTLAAARRVHGLLEEAPEVEDVIQGETPSFEGLSVENLHFTYEEESILQGVTVQIHPEEITCIQGKSGSGKSTLVKLMLRFWQSEGISISGTALDVIETAHLRRLESYMTQDTDLFSGSILDNIRIAKLDASMEEVVEASQKASLHDFVLSLPEGYDQAVGELGSRLSGGERQRIGLARAFLRQAPLLILDEPSSNLDSLNESMILRSLQDYDKAVILISHRQSTLAIGNRCYQMTEGRLENRS